MSAINNLLALVRRSKHFGVTLGLVVASAYLVFGVLNVHKHGVTIDSPSLFRIADRTLYWVQNGGRAEDIDMHGPEPAGFQSQFDYCPDGGDRFHYPILPAFVGSVASYVVHDKLDWMDPIDGHHVGLVFMNAVALFLYGVYTTRFVGKGAGLLATLTLALFPLALGHSFNNAKDWPCAQFYGLALLAVGTGVIARRSRDVVLGGVFAGIALASKLNGAFALATLGLFTPIAFVALYFRQRRLTFPLLVAVIAVPFIAIWIFFFTWPWLYHGPVHEWYGHVYEYLRFMGAYGVSDRDSWTAYPVLVATWMTPPAALVATAFAATATWRVHNRVENTKLALLVLWLAVPLLRIALPRSNFYDMNRHFIEYVPALSVLAGRGAAALLAFVYAALRESPAFARATAFASVATAYGVGIASPAVHSFPFETMYFNRFAGGLGGAQLQGLSSPEGMHDGRVAGCEGDFWFSTTRSAYEDAVAHGASDRAPIAICGPDDGLLLAWSRGILPRLVYADTREAYRASHLIVIPREGSCCWSAIRQFERERPIVSRVELDGGLVYEVLGAYEGERYEPTSPPNHYTDSGSSCRVLDQRAPPPRVRRP